MKPLIINRSVDFIDNDSKPYIVLELGSGETARPYFLGILPISYLPDIATEKDANDFLSALKHPGNADALFDMLTSKVMSPDPRMNQIMMRMFYGAFLNDDFPDASTIVAGAGFDTDGQFMDADKIVTDVSTLLVAMEIPKSRDDAHFLKDNEAHWRFNVAGTSSFFGRRWECQPSGFTNKADFQLRYSSDDESWARGWRLFITAVYPPERLA
jgi:hypothetical protein|tara:strand:+ start:344 stop:982 length:639 start_codon:yes stop_codon:yes gene_type:complete